MASTPFSAPLFHLPSRAPRYIRPIDKLRIWIAGGLTPADSDLEGGSPEITGLPPPNQTPHSQSRGSSASGTAGLLPRIGDISRRDDATEMHIPENCKDRPRPRLRATAPYTLDRITSHLYRTASHHKTSCHARCYDTTQYHLM